MEKVLDVDQFTSAHGTSDPYGFSLYLPMLIEDTGNGAELDLIKADGWSHGVQLGRDPVRRIANAGKRLAGQDLHQILDFFGNEDFSSPLYIAALIFKIY